MPSSDKTVSFQMVPYTLTDPRECSASGVLHFRFFRSIVNLWSQVAFYGTVFLVSFMYVEKDLLL